MHIFTVKPEVLEWLANRNNNTSPENDWIDIIDETQTEQPDLTIPVPSLEGINDDLIWIWRCRESGLTWTEISALMGYTNASGVWKKFKKLLKKEKLKLETRSN